MGLHSEVDFRNSVDTGEANADSIVPITDGEPANQTNLRRPTENTRARTDALRKIVREHTILTDLDRCGSPHLFGYYGAVVTFNGAYASYSGTFTLAEQIYLLPFATPGNEGVAPPFVGSTKAFLLAEDGVNGMLFTAKYKQWEAPSGGDPGEAADGNNISVEIQDTGSLSVSVGGADGYVNNILIGIDYGTTTIQQVIDAVAAHATASKLVVATAVSPAGNPAPKYSEAEWGTDYSGRFLRGGAGGIAHIITNANLAAFFSAHTDNLIRQGDTIAIWYDKLVDMSGTMKDGRFQSTQENTNQTIPSTAFFNTRREPEKIPNCIPICKCVEEDTLLFVDGSYIIRDYPARLGADSRIMTMVQHGLLSTPLNWDRIGNGPDHNPPTTIRQALDNADGRLHSVMTEVENARTNGFETPAGSHLDLEGRIDRLGDHSTMGGTILSVGYDGGGSAGFDEMYMGASGLADAITAIKGFTTYRVGGTIHLWPGGTLQSYQIGATFPTINKPIHFVSPGITYIRNNRGLGANQYVFDFTAGADGSTMENIHVIEDASPSNKALRLTGVTDITIRNCHFIGRVLLEGCKRVSFENCTFAEGTNLGGTEFNVVEVSGVNASACRNISFKNCRFTATADVSTNEVVKFSSSTEELLNEQTNGVLLENCYVDVPNALNGMDIQNNGGVTALNVTFKMRPYFGGNKVLTINNATADLQRLRFELADFSSATIYGSFIHITNAADVKIDGVRIDTQVCLLGAYAAGNNPIYVSSANVVISGLFWFGILIPDSGGIATLDPTRPLILIEGQNGGKAELRNSQIWGIISDPSASGNTSFTILGGSSGAEGGTAGTQIFDNILIDGSLITYTGGSYLRYMVNQLQQGAIIRNCVFTGGVIGAAVRADAHAVVINDNRFAFLNFATQITSAIVLDGYTNDRCDRCRITDNQIIVCDTLGNTVDIQGDGAHNVRDGVFTNNTVRNIENNTPPSNMVYFNYCENWTVMGNVVYSTGTRIGYSNVTNMVPAVGSLGTLNALN